MLHISNTYNSNLNIYNYLQKQHFEQKKFQKQRARVVKELVLKANGLCPRELKSCRCRFLNLHYFCKTQNSYTFLEKRMYFFDIF